MHDIARNLANLRARIAAAERDSGRIAGSVGLLAVSKAKTASEVRIAFDAGQRAFGESYVQEALEKLDALDLPGIEWHFIGPVQSNKTRPIAERFAWVHGLDRLKIARRLSEQRPAGLGDLSVCVQVNVSGEASKSGIAPADVIELARAVAALPRLRLRGLMAVPAPARDAAAQRAPFARLRELLQACRAAGLDVDTLSMGMSDDMESAIAEGATIVRIGTAVFGPRETVQRTGSDQ